MDLKTVNPNIDLNKDLKIVNPNIYFNPNIRIPELIIAMGPTSNGKRRWAYATGGPIESKPAIGSDGTIYVGSYDMKLYALDIKGKVKWEFPAGGKIYSSPTIGADGTIYVGSTDMNLYAIGQDGEKKWEFMTGSIVATPAIGADGTLYVGSGDGKLYAIESDGTKLWDFAAGSGIYSSPAIGADGTIFVASHDKKLYAVNPKDGSKKWEFSTGGYLFSSPVIGSDGTLYVGSHDMKLYAIHSGNGKPRWEFNTGGEIDSSPTIGSDGTIYVGSDDKHLYAVKPDGKVKWKFATGSFVRSSPAVGADGTIYVGSYDKKLYAIHPKDGTEKWHFDTGGEIVSSPSIGPDGAVYIGSNDYIIYAVGMVLISDNGLNKSELVLKIGQSETLQMIIKPDDATFKDIAWRSSDVHVATVDGSGKVTGIAPGLATITAIPEYGGNPRLCIVTVTDEKVPPATDDKPTADITLSDIDGHWAEDNIVQAVIGEIVKGYPDGTFKPDRTVTRAEFAVMLMQGLKSADKGEPLSFKDKDKIGSWAVPSVQQAVKLGIIKGYTDGTFRPNANITHAEMISMVMRASGIPFDNEGKTGFTDDADIAKWAKPAVSKAEETGIIIVGGLPDGYFGPQAMTTRAESASSIVRMLEIKK